MAYFSINQNAIERRGKIAADIACALLLAGGSIAYLGFLRGIVAFLIVEGMLLAVDYVVPSEDDAHGVVR
jgi:hypothetical protein